VVKTLPNGAIASAVAIPEGRGQSKRGNERFNVAKLDERSPPQSG